MCHVLHMIFDALVLELQDESKGNKEKNSLKTTDAHALGCIRQIRECEG